jgi:predicted permease
VVGEIALCLSLLGSVGILAEGMSAALGRELGLRPEGVVTFALDPPGKRYTREAALRLFDDLLEKVRQDARVLSAGAVATLPMTGGYSGTGYEVEGRLAPRDWVEQMTQINAATPDYFRAMGIRLVRGRPFNEGDDEDGEKVAIVDETFARKAFGAEDPLGRRIRFHKGEWMTVVGVAGAIRHQAPTNNPVAMVYRPHRQDGGVQWVAVRSTAGAGELAALVKRCMNELDRGLPVLRLRTMEEVVEDSMQLPRMLTSTGAMAAGFALVLSAMGLFGLVAYSVAQRRREISIRMALGATGAQMVAMAARRGLRLAGMGAALGLPVALAAGRMLGAELQWVKAWNPAALVSACALLVAVAWLASYWPARRVAGLDPARGLRVE